MTNSTDKAAASAAIRIAPRSGRVKAGVVLDRDGVTVVQSREGIDAIERAAYVAYPADCGNAPEDRAGFAARVIRQRCRQAQRLRCLGEPLRIRRLRLDASRRQGCRS